MAGALEYEAGGGEAMEEEEEDGAGLEEADA